ncbi:MAG: hypothetical protein Q8M31_04940 [Beijerinckiaceae bacterium]|nr:hypothetical protein [Beijerinckiaceae bacterium]
MARKKEKVETGYVLFDVEYEDGTRSSNRRAPKALLGGLDGDEPARRAIEDQDKEIASQSGQPPRKIKKMSRVKK